MKLYPTSGQTSSSMVHSARPLTISASSLASSGCSDGAHRRYGLGERKEQFLQRYAPSTGLRSQLVERTYRPHLPSRDKDETVANPLGVGQLVNGENERASFDRLTADHLNDVASLPKIEAIERLVHEQHVLRRQKT